MSKPPAISYVKPCRLHEPAPEPGAVYKTPSGAYLRIDKARPRGFFTARRVHLHHLADLPHSHQYVSHAYINRMALAWTAAQWLAKQAERVAEQLEIERKRAMRPVLDAQDDARGRAIDFEAKAKAAYDRKMAKLAFEAGATV